MSLRLIRCHACRTAFQAEDDPSAGPLACPKCGARLARPRAKAPADPTTPAPSSPSSSSPTEAPSPAEAGPAGISKATAEAGPSVFVPSDEARRASRRRRVRWLAAATALTAAVVVGVLVALPMFRGRAKPIATDPVSSAATAYLKAIAAGDQEAAHRLGTVELPPAIRSFRNVRRDLAGDLNLKGTFAPIAGLHARIDAKYMVDPGSGRLVPKDALGPAAEVLDTLHAAKDQAEKDGLYKKMQSGNPEDIFDAAEAMAKPFAALAEGVLSPRKLLPTYKGLVEGSEPPLPPAERSLALDYADRRETWDALLGRPFATLKADGPFLLERAEVTASVADALASSGDPPTTLRLALTRFRLEGIDTGWKVTSARREGPKDAPKATPSEAPKPDRDAPSPGERKASP